MLSLCSSPTEIKQKAKISAEVVLHNLAPDPVLALSSHGRHLEFPTCHVKDYQSSQPVEAAGSLLGDTRQAVIPNCLNFYSFMMHLFSIDYSSATYYFCRKFLATFFLIPTWTLTADALLQKKRILLVFCGNCIHFIAYFFKEDGQINSYLRSWYDLFFRPIAAMTLLDY